MVSQDGLSEVLNLDAFKLCTQLPDESFDLILTDPPYGITDETFDVRLSTQDINVLAREFARLTRSCVFIFIPLDQIVVWKSALRCAGMSHIRSGVWVKTSNQYNPQPYPTNSLEYWVYADKLTNPKYSRMVLPSYASSTSPRMRDYEGIRHPHFKPISLLRTIIWNHTLKKPQYVFDPFCGGGSVGVAALLEGHSVLLNDSCLEFVENARYFCSASELFKGHRKIGASMTVRKTKAPIAAPAVLEEMKDIRSGVSPNKTEGSEEAALKPKKNRKKRHSFTADEILAIRKATLVWNSKKGSGRETPAEFITSLKGKKGARGAIKKNVKDDRIWAVVSQFVSATNKMGLKKGAKVITLINPRPSKAQSVEGGTEALLKELGFSIQ